MAFPPPGESMGIGDAGAVAGGGAERGLEWVRGRLDGRDYSFDVQSMLCLSNLVTYMAVRVCVTSGGVRVGP